MKEMENIVEDNKEQLEKVWEEISKICVRLQYVEGEASKEFCYWKFYETDRYRKGYTPICLPYDCFYDVDDVRDFSFCPYCGMRIEFVPSVEQVDQMED